MNYENKVGFAIGTGRCGTLFLYQLMDREPAVASSHERNPDNEPSIGTASGTSYRSTTRVSLPRRNERSGPIC